ncbi:MAG: hypothetical protein AAF125_27450, partial [Chloroflexota bacterium]
TGFRDVSYVGDLLMILGGDERAAQAEALLERLDAAPGDLPPYNLLLLVDTATDEEQVALVLLGYDTVADAEAAAEILPARVENYFSLAARMPLSELLENRFVEEVTAEVVPAEDGERAALVLRFAAPKAPDAASIIAVTDMMQAEPMGFPPPGQVFRLLANSVFARDIGWLNAVPQAEEQALLEKLAETGE